ncbi:hypothetical protein DMJ13_19010 [halophilic archaeon]|nr:hypothetical protein DMJ13_19010 [halophilic archaeon]
MALTATKKTSVSGVTRWLHGLWEYYRRYTHTAIHAASAAALAAFGLLVVVDHLFVVLAIASYICPPIVLYSLGAEYGKTPSSPDERPARTDSEMRSNSDSDIDSDSDDGDSDSDSDDGDTDSDGADADADADGGDADADADG